MWKFKWKEEKLAPETLLRQVSICPLDPLKAIAQAVSGPNYLRTGSLPASFLLDSTGNSIFPLHEPLGFPFPTFSMPTILDSRANKASKSLQEELGPFQSSDKVKYTLSLAIESILSDRAIV